jgi:arylformamidase
MSYIDITAPLSEAMPIWPGTRPLNFQQVSFLPQGDMANSHVLDIPNHLGTHMDAPYHFVQEGKKIDELPLEVACGPAQLIYIPTEGEISLEEIQQAGIRPETKRLLIRTKNSENTWWTEPFRESFGHLSTEAAEYLAGLGLQLIGIDYLSVSGYNTNEVAVHEAILGNNIWIIEGLVLRDLAAGIYELYCLPLKLAGLDGAPCRAILKPVS